MSSRWIATPMFSDSSSLSEMLKRFGTRKYIRFGESEINRIHRTTVPIKFATAAHQPTSTSIMANQGDFSTLCADACSLIDETATSDSHKDICHNICNSAFPAPTKFWKSATSKNEDLGSTITAKGEESAQTILAIRKLMALSIGHEIISCELASWKATIIQQNDQR